MKPQRDLVLNFLHSSREFTEATRRCLPTGVVEGLFTTASIPAIVNAAFSVELAFKAIYIAENGTTISGHNLFKLFGKLSPAAQKVISDAVGAPSYPRYVPPRDFAMVLENSGEAFKEWRYLCEGFEKDKEIRAADPAFLLKCAETAQDYAQRMVVVAANS